MSQLSLFEDEATVATPLPLEQRYRLWVARQSGIYCEVLDEIEREAEGGRVPVCLRSVFETLKGQPDLAPSFSRGAAFEPAFAGPMANMMIGFGDVRVEEISTTIIKKESE